MAAEIDVSAPLIRLTASVMPGWGRLGDMPQGWGISPNFLDVAVRVLASAGCIHFSMVTKNTVAEEMRGGYVFCFS